MIKADFNPKIKVRIGKEWLDKVLSSANKILKKKKSYRVSVALLGEQEIKTLNKIYRGKNKPTDVLSFPGAGEKFISPKIKEIYLGEIVICPKVAQTTANRERISLTCEMQRLFVHGLLHLLGYKHKTTKEEKRMLGLQEKILMNTK